MREAAVRVSNKLGLHARAAGKLVNLARGFASDIEIARQDDPQKRANAKSILAVLALSANANVALTVSANGEDEDDAIEDIARLFEQSFGEDQHPIV